MPGLSPNTKSNRSSSMEEIIVSEQLAELRGRVRVLTWISGLCWTAVALVGGWLVTAILDWSFHFDESGTRLLFGLALLSISAWTAWRYLVAPLRQRLSGSFLALRVERRFPCLNNRIVSAVEFLEHRLDPKLGSFDLQKAVVKQAIKDLERVATSDVVSMKAIRNITIAGTLVCALAAMLTAVCPREAVTSVKRLALPFSNVPWPRAVELELVRADLSAFVHSDDKPLSIVRGETLELYARNRRGHLPQRVWFEYREGDEGTIVRESLRQTEIRDESGRSYETAIISWIATRGTMSFRVSGGDDDVMPFHRVEVVQPPGVQSLQVTVTPPAYSRWPVETMPSGVGHVQGLIGSKVEATVTSDKELKSAGLRIGNEPPLPIELQSDNRSFTARFVINEAGASTYWFELVDTQGFTDHEAIRYELRGIADGLPEVVIESPISDVSLTADATLPVNVMAKDDLGLRAIQLKYQLGESSEDHTIPLFDGGPILEPGTLDPAAPPRANRPQQQNGNLDWKMSDLHLEPGATIVFHAEATDDCDLAEPHIGKSIPRTITIVSRDEKQKELAARVGNLLEEMTRATQLQQRSRQQTQELQTQVDNVGELRPQDLDQLRRTELDQRQAASRLTHPSDGIETQAEQLLEEFKANQIADSGTVQRLERLTSELNRLEREELPEAEKALTKAQKLAESEPQQAEPKQADSQQPDKQAADFQEKTPQDRELANALSEAIASQTKTLDTLQELQDSLAEWKDRRDVSRDLDSVIAEQEAIQKAASDLAQRTIAKTAAELSKQDKAEFNKLAAKQEKVAEQLEQFGNQLEKAIESLQKNDPDSAEKLSEIVKEIQQRETPSKLRDAAQDIADNKLGMAEKTQQSAMEELREVERMIKQKPNDDTEQFLKQTEEAQREFQQLRQEQQNLADQAEQLAKQADSPKKHEQLQELMEQQEDLAERMAKAERKLERLRLHGAADAARRARQRINQMMKQVREADDAEEMQQAMDEALDDLEQVERELVLEKRIAQERLAFEQLEKLEDELKALRARQESVISETARLDAAKGEQDSLSRGQLKTLKDLAETERSLQHAAERLQQQMASSEILSLFLKQLARSLRLAADGLAERNCGAPTQALQNDAIRKIESLLAALKQEAKKQESPPQQPAEQREELSEESQEQPEKPEEAQPPGESIPEIALLKLLKAMQEGYLERTEFIERFREPSGKLPESMEAELAELAHDQIELAGHARKLLAKFQQQPEQKPDNEPVKQPEEKPKEKEIDPSKIDL